MVNLMVEAIKSNNRIKKMQFEDIQEINITKANTELRGNANLVRTELDDNEK